MCGVVTMWSSGGRHQPAGRAATGAGHAAAEGHRVLREKEQLWRYMLVYIYLATIRLCVNTVSQKLVEPSHKATMKTIFLFGNDRGKEKTIL